MKARTTMLLCCAAILLALLCMASGCTSYQPASPAAPAAATPSQAAATGGSTVTLKDFAFSPATLTIKAGSTVTWVNQDAATHTVTSDQDSPEAFSSGQLPTGATWSHTFPVAGTYTYHCSIHPSMKGTIVVQP